MGKIQREKYGQGPRKKQIPFLIVLEENKHGKENFCVIMKERRVVVVHTA